MKIVQVMLVCLLVVLLTVGCRGGNNDSSINDSASNEDREATATVEDTVVASGTSTPKETKLPTATSVPPSATPEPTRTTIPTVTVILATATSVPPTPTLVPTLTTVPTEVPTIPAPNDSYASRGLGASRAQWEQSHTHTGSDFFEEYDGGYVNGGFDIAFADDHIRIIYGSFEADFLSPSEVEFIGKQYLPVDSELIETYSRDVTVVHLYYSSSLANRIDAEHFCNTEPGYFTFQYNNYDGEVESYIIATGNCP